MAKLNSVPLNTSILKNKTLVSPLQRLDSSTDKDRSRLAKRGQVTSCVQKADRRGKNFSRLLELQKVVPNTKSCSKVAEHNRDRP